MSPEHEVASTAPANPASLPPGRRYFHWQDDSSSDSSESDTPLAEFASSASPQQPQAGESESERQQWLRSTRRANARLITSNVIPDMNSPDEMPYCVWYPGLATENTYRTLARRYPILRYQVGRACAVGGYLMLYLELDLLPDVSIAEEARESGNDGSTAIFKHIMSQPTRYAVMDDYRRTVNLASPRGSACLNGDTAISPPPDKRDGDGDQHWIWPNYFDITEEWSDHPPTWERPWDPSRTQVTDLPRKFTDLLHSPLLPDLPTTLKDNLVLMAAYEGNVDRYHRLRRPVMIESEQAAVIRGIYHSTSFAMYWDKCDFDFARHIEWDCIYLAIMARRVMVNDLSGIEECLDDKGGPGCFPRLIWHPLFPRPETLMELIRRRPNNPCIRRSVALASIAADYHWIYDTIKPWPVMRLWQQALKSPNPHYREDLKRRAASGEYPGVKPEDFPDQYCDWYEQEAKDLRPTSTRLSDFRHSWGLIEPVGGASYYQRWEIEANAAAWELYMCTSDELRDQAEKGSDQYLDLYADWKYDITGWKKSLPWYNKEEEAKKETRESEEIKGKDEEGKDTEAENDSEERPEVKSSE